MASGNDDKAEAVVALVSGAIIGVAVAMLLVRWQRNRAIAARAAQDDYCYDGGDLFI